MQQPNKRVKTPIKIYLAKGYYNPLKIASVYKQIKNMKVEGESFSALQSIIAELEKDMADLNSEYEEIKEHLRNFTTNTIYQQVLDLYYFTGMDAREIADLFNITPRRVKTLLFTAVNAFESYLIGKGINYQ